MERISPVPTEQEAEIRFSCIQRIESDLVYLGQSLFVGSNDAGKTGRDHFVKVL